MIRTVREAADYLLNYLSEPERVIPATVEDGKTLYPGRIEAALQSINGALQELFALGALHSARRGFGEHINPPTTVTFPVATGSRLVRFLPENGWKEWMMGCTCQISGDGADNQIIDFDALTSILTLKHPFAGTESGEKQVAVYHDCIKPDKYAGEILSCNLENYGPLSPANSPKGLQPQTHDEEDFDFHGAYANHGFLSPGEKLTHFVGTPQRYFVDSFARENKAPEKRIRLFPLPDKPFVLSYRARILPPQFSEQAIYLKIPEQITSSSITYTWDSGAQKYEADSDTEFLMENGKWVLKNVTVPPGFVDLVGPRSWEGPGGDYYPLTGTPSNTTLVTGASTSTVIATEIPEATLPIQNDWVESVFLPIAAQRFQISSFFRNDSATDEIKRQYEAAFLILNASAPQTKKGITIRPLHG